MDQLVSGAGDDRDRTIDLALQARAEETAKRSRDLTALHCSQSMVADLDLPFQSSPERLTSARSVIVASGLHRCGCRSLMFPAGC